MKWILKTGGVAALALMLVMSMVAMPAAAAAIGVQFDANHYDVDEEGDDIPVEIIVEADADGLTDEPVTFDVIDDTGTVVHTDEQPISVDPDVSDSVTFVFDADAEGVAAGSYDVEATADGQTDISTLDVHAVADEFVNAAVTFDADEYELDSETDTVTINSTLFAGDTESTDDLVFEIVDDEGAVVVDSLEENVAVAAGEEQGAQWKIDSAEFDADGAYDVEVMWGDDTDETTLVVGTVTSGGAAIDSDSLTDPIVVAGSLIAIIFGLLAARAAE